MNDIELPISFRSALVSYTRDLTDAAVRDQLEPVRARELEIERVIAVLMRQSKNNPVLVGEAGAGKTAIAEGLAQRICAGQVPEALRGTRVLAFSHIDLIAGTSFRGQYERRLQRLIREALRNPEVILFIDELHNLIGAGTALGAPMDAANMLKPVLAGGRLRVIGATTQDEFDRYIVSDSALERRFQPIAVTELGRDETLEVLRARRPRLEIHHAVTITDDALEAATDLSEDFLPDRLQPDRSIDLLDETCARSRMLRECESPESIAGLRHEHAVLVAHEQRAIDETLAIARSKGTPLERFSFGTFRVFEKMGQEVEKFLTGQASPRPPLPLPDSVRRLQQSNPAAQLAKIHCERLLLEDRLRDALASSGLTVSSEQVQAMLPKRTPRN